jgi:hypothetical protein
MNAWIKGPGWTRPEASPQQQAQIDGQERHLKQQERWRRCQQKTGVAAAQMREGDDVVDAGRQEDEQNRQSQHRIVRQELHQHGSDRRHDDKVGHEQRAEEARIAQGRPKFRQRNLEEGHEQHHCQRRIDGNFKCTCVRNGEADERPDCDGDEVDRNLACFHDRSSLFHSSCSLPSRPRRRFAQCAVVTLVFRLAGSFARRSTGGANAGRPRRHVQTGHRRRGDRRFALWPERRSVWG